MNSLYETAMPRERERAWADGDHETAGVPEKKTALSVAAEQRENTRRILADPDNVDDIMASVSEGERVADIAKKYGVRYAEFHRVLKARHGERLQAARAAYADNEVSKNMDLADKIQDGRVDAQAGKAAAGIRQWYAERAGSDSWGQKSTMDINHRGVVGLHMDALKQFMDAPLEGEVEAEEAEYEELPERTDVDDHPLL